MNNVAKMISTSDYSERFKFTDDEVKRIYASGVLEDAARSVDIVHLTKNYDVVKAFTTNDNMTTQVADTLVGRLGNALTSLNPKSKYFEQNQEDISAAMLKVSSTGLVSDDYKSLYITNIDSNLSETLSQMSMESLNDISLKMDDLTEQSTELDF